jgi:hypothetical protein
LYQDVPAQREHHWSSKLEERGWSNIKGEYVERGSKIIRNGRNCARAADGRSEKAGWCEKRRGMRRGADQAVVRRGLDRVFARDLLPRWTADEFTGIQRLPKHSHC